MPQMGLACLSQGAVLQWFCDLLCRDRLGLTRDPCCAGILASRRMLSRKDMVGCTVLKAHLSQACSSRKDGEMDKPHLGATEQQHQAGDCIWRTAWY